MAVGKNKRISKGKKGGELTSCCVDEPGCVALALTTPLSLLAPAGKKKAQDPFSRKDWYDIKAPTVFAVRQVGKTLVTRTTGTKVLLEGDEQQEQQEQQRVAHAAAAP